jgi:hypothetical protein
MSDTEQRLVRAEGILIGAIESAHWTEVKDGGRFLLIPIGTLERVLGVLTGGSFKLESWDAALEHDAALP